MAVRITTNIPSHLGVGRVVPNGRVIRWDSQMDAWNVSEVFA
jgi:hypothetical protein